jgi:CheY-like chemotaxis protein
LLLGLPAAEHPQSPGAQLREVDRLHQIVVRAGLEGAQFRPEIILSALDSDTDRQRGLDAGADAYAVKAGLDRDNFLRQVDMLVGVDRKRP